MEKLCKCIPDGAIWMNKRILDKHRGSTTSEIYSLHNS